MSDCPDLELLATLSRLPAGDPRRAHLDGCARCGARLIALEEFLSPAAGDLPEGEWLAAEDELRRRRVRDRLVAPPAQPRTSRRAWAPSAWRPMLAAAAVVVMVAAGAWLASRGRGPSELRAVASGDWVPTVERRGGEAGIAWRASPGADRYRLVFLDASLDSVATLEVGPALEARVRADALPTGLTHGQSVMVEVNAMRGPDRIATSRAVPLTLP